MKKVMGVATFIIYASAFSQTSVKLFTGLNYLARLEQDFDYNYMEKRFAFSMIAGICSPYQLTNWINLTPSFSYNYYFYRSLDVSIDPETRLVSSSGKGSNVLRTTGVVQLIDQAEPNSKPYLELGGGYIIEYMGSIHGTWVTLGHVDSTVVYKGFTNKYFVYSIGIGDIIYISNDLNLDVSAKYFSDTNDRFYYLFGINATYNIFN